MEQNNIDERLQKLYASCELLRAEIARMRKNTPKLELRWTPELVMTIPDALFWSEVGRRNSAKRKTNKGGIVWGKHNPDTTRCRCEKCNTKRRKAAE